MRTTQNKWLLMSARFQRLLQELLLGRMLTVSFLWGNFHHRQVGLLLFSMRSGFQQQQGFCIGTIIMNDWVSVRATPATRLHVANGNSGVTPDSNADDLFVENSSDAGITIGSGIANSGAIKFGNTNNSSIGAINYNHVSDNMSITVNGSTAMTIASDGMAVIGDVAVAGKLVIGDLDNAACIANAGLDGLFLDKNCDDIKR